jgi:hypothetical protein
MNAHLANFWQNPPRNFQRAHAQQYYLRIKEGTHKRDRIKGFFLPASWPLQEEMERGNYHIGVYLWFIKHKNLTPISLWAIHLKRLGLAWTTWGGGMEELIPVSKFVKVITPSCILFQGFYVEWLRGMLLCNNSFFPEEIDPKFSLTQTHSLVS